MGKWDRFKSAFGVKSDADKYFAKRDKIVTLLVDSASSLGPRGQASAGPTKGSQNSRIFQELAAERDNLWDQLPALSVTPPDLKRATKDLEGVEKAAKKLLKKASQIMNVTTPLGRTVNVQMVSGFDGMSDTDKTDALRDVDARCLRGKETTDAVLGKSREAPPARPTLQDVGDVLWHLRMSAEEVATEAFKKGAITVPDPDGKLQKWLDKCAEVYIRDSSHLMGDNKAVGRESDQKVDGQAPRGMDFYAGRKKGEGKDQSQLPYGMNALLYQTLERDGQTLLYIKMETEGGYIQGGKATDKLKRSEHRKADDEVDGRGMRKSDVKDSILHGINLVKSKLGHKEDNVLSRHGEAAKEVPQQLLDKYRSIMDQAEQSPLLKAMIGGDLSTFARIKADKKGRERLIIEVQQMLQNLLSAYDRVDGMRQHPDCPVDVHGLLDDMLADMDDWVDLCEDVGMALDTLNVRVGNEVILTDADI